MGKSKKGGSSSHHSGDKRKRETTPPSEDFGDSEYSEEEFSFESDDESDLEVGHHRRRGRSPRDRRSRMASVTTKVSNHGTIKASKVKHNGESSSYRKASYCDQVVAVDPGFDDVEDLEV